MRLAKIYDFNGHVLLLGVGSNTSMHLREHQSGCLKTTTNSAPMFEEGKRLWKTFEEIEYDKEVFPEIGQVLKLPIKRLARLKPAYCHNKTLSILRRVFSKKDSFRQ